MAKDSKTPKAEPAPKKEAAKAEKETAKDTAQKDTAKAEAADSAAAPSNYSRGEGQKPVTAAYRENWNAIFANKRKK